MVANEGIRLGEVSEARAGINRPKSWDKFVSPVVPNVETYDSVVELPSPDFLAHIDKLASEVVSSEDYKNQDDGFISDLAWKKLTDGGVLAASFGDRSKEKRAEEIMQTSRILSFHDINLGLTFGITTGLAILPIERFGTEAQKEKYLGKIRLGERFGLAVTERDRSGSGALEMDSKYQMNDDGTTSLRFQKRFQGLSGKSGLIVAADKEGVQTQTIGLFIVDKHDINTQITNMAGLHGIAYAINTGDVRINTRDHLMQELSRRGLFDFQDMFTKSRLLFVSMVLGHHERTEQEALRYATSRKIGDKMQIDMDVPGGTLDKISARRIVSEAILNQVAQYSNEGSSVVDADTARLTMEANIVKTLPTEYALASAADRAELKGGAAFFKDDALQDYVNIWPFQIFEGPRMMHNTQIANMFLKKPPRPTEDGSALFNVGRAHDNMDEEVGQIVDAMGTHSVQTVERQIIGQIVARYFALGCIDAEQLTPLEYKRATDLLKTEIKHLHLDLKEVEQNLGELLSENIETHVGQ